MGFTDVLLPDDMRNENLLKADPLYERLDDKQREEAVSVAVQTGEDYSVWLDQHYGDWPILEILQELEVKVEYKNTQIAQLIPYSIYRMKTRTITLHVNIIEQLVKELNGFTGDISNDELTQNVTNVILFHELFHHLEETKFGKASKQYKVKVIRLGRFGVSSGIKALSEIGEIGRAHV